MPINTLSQENRDLVSKLYSLKAGLSLVSVEADRIREAEAKLTQITENIENKKCELQNEQKLIARQMRRKRELDSFDAEKMAKAKKERKSGTVILVAGAILFALVLAIMSALGEVFASASSAITVLLFVEIVGVVAIAAIHFKKAKDIENTKSDPKEITEVNEGIAQRSRIIGDKKARVDVLEGELRKFTPIHDKTVDNAQKRAMVLFDSLYEMYNDSLEVRDWGNIDYIIYTFETGRADSLSAALRMLDEERRYEGVMTAIGRASEEISRTLSTSIGALGIQLENQFRALGAKIDTNSRAIISATHASAAAMAASTAELSSSLGAKMDLQNALIKKSNKNSSALASDMDYIATRVRNK